MARLVGLIFAFSLLVGPTLVSPAGVRAAEVAPVGVSVVTVGVCEFRVDVSWLEPDVRGRSVTVTLYRSEDGGEPALIGRHVRTENGGTDMFPGGLTVPGVDYQYFVAVTKGPKHVVASGESAPVSCASPGA